MVSTARIGARPRRWPIVVLVVVVIAAVLFTILSGFLIDVLWFREVGQSSVFWTTLRTKLLLGTVFGLIFFGLLYLNLQIARWITPSTRVLTPDQEILERARDTVEPYLGWALPLGVGVLALFVGIGVSHEWQTYLLWRGGSGLTFGTSELQFHRDAAFYVFTLPWLRFLQGWLFSSLAGVTLLTAIAHVLWGGIRPQAPAFADKVAPAVRAHLSVLLGLIMLVKAWGYWLGRFDLLTSHRGVVDGASYTDVNAQLPALTFLTIVAAICAVLFFLNIRVRLWSLPIIAVALLVVVSVLLGSAYPAFIQQFRVNPNEQGYELPYIDRNIEGTRAAFGLDQVQVQERTAAGELTAKDIENNQATVDNIRLWRPSVLVENFRVLQRIRQYYEFYDVDVDRYPVGDNGQPRVLMVSGREVSQNAIATGGKTWVNQHLTYTHGFGAVASLVNTATSEGQPVLTLEGIPPVGVPTLDQPRIYYGEKSDVPFVLVKTAVDELDYEGAPPGEAQPYAGTGGIQLNNILERAMFAWHFRDINLITTSAINSQSRIMINRDIYSRVPKPVPFLGFDRDPYLAIVEGRIVWIWDAYTSTDEYPYSQTVDLERATDGDLVGDVNYVRNSVKVVVDAYDGTMTYWADLSEPIVAAWSRVFPDLFTDIATAPPELREHFRYPENLLQIQATQFANYHVTDPSVFYQKQDFWQIPPDPTVAVPAGSTQPKTRPYYVLMRLPGEQTEGFHLVLPFVPENRQNMVAWMAASSDPDQYGQVLAYRFPNDRIVEGPSQVFSRINADRSFSSQRSLLDQAGSKVVFGDFLVVPIEDSFLYVQPVYVLAATTTAIPELKFVIVVNGSGGPISLGNDLQEAIDIAVEGGVEEPGQDGGPSGGPLAGQIQDLLDRALTHFLAADDALQAGDLGLYQEELAKAQDLVRRADELAASRGGGGPVNSPTPTPSGSASPAPPSSAAPTQVSPSASASP